MKPNISDADRRRLDAVLARIDEIVEQAQRLEVEVKEWFASHWRDDDSPLAEKTFGVCAI